MRKTVDWSKAVHATFPNLKPTTQRISMRLPLHLLERIKVAANARGVSYQSLIKIWLEEKVRS
jgi:predicted DNA binding CopG/RHH family protein